jgi:hypothetical protein
MSQTRTVLGLLVMIFFAIPVLFGVIWAVGLTQAVVSQKTLSQLPREVISEIPELVDGILLAAKDENTDIDADSRAWLTAMAGVSKTPSELLKETGLNDWLEKELSESLREIGDILNGKTEARSVWLDMLPLKQALNHPAMEVYLAEVIERLPVCTPEQAHAWEAESGDIESCGEVPSCRPETVTGQSAGTIIRARLTRDIPDQVDLFKNSDLPRRRVNVVRIVTSVTYLLFLIPAFFIVIGALIAARSKSHFFRWSGAVTLIGGGLALGLATLVKQIVPWSLHVRPEEYSWHWQHYHGLIGDRMGNIAMIFSRHLTAPVIAVAGAVCVVGLLLFAFSFTFSREQNTNVPAPQTPAS